MKIRARWVLGTAIAAVAWAGYALVRARAVYEDRNAERIPLHERPGDSPVPFIDLTDHPRAEVVVDLTATPASIPAQHSRAHR